VVLPADQGNLTSPVFVRGVSVAGSYMAATLLKGLCAVRVQEDGDRGVVAGQLSPGDRSVTQGQRPQGGGELTWTI
jgi:hypothetical protein